MAGSGEPEKAPVAGSGEPEKAHMPESDMMRVEYDPQVLPKQKDLSERDHNKVQMNAKNTKKPRERKRT
jgi:hypothetical protein